MVVVVVVGNIGIGSVVVLVVVFDPSAYGQYMGGTDAEKKPGFIDVGHPIGKLIMMGELRVVREGDQLYVIHGGRKIKLNNLHVHSKQTAQFL